MDFFPVSIQSQNPQNPIWEKKFPKSSSTVSSSAVLYLSSSFPEASPTPIRASTAAAAVPYHSSAARRRSRFNLSASMPSSTPSAISAFGF
jgi:hypothetical protein